MVRSSSNTISRSSGTAKPRLDTTEATELTGDGAPCDNGRGTDRAFQYPLDTCLHAAMSLRTVRRVNAFGGSPAAVNALMTPAVKSSLPGSP